MSQAYAPEYFDSQGMAVSATMAERAAFIQKVYVHVGVALLGLAAGCALLLNYVPDQVLMTIFGRGNFGFLFILLGFMGITWLAQRWAQSDMSPGMQYLGLALYVAAESVILWPLLWMCTNIPVFEGILGQAVVLTLTMAVGLTVAVLMTGKDFSFLRTGITIGSFLAFGVVIAAILFGVSLGLWFSLAMIGLMSACILYQTSQVLYHYRTDQYVAAALVVFASIATLFFYVLRALMAARSND